ncbi:small integral membrane protein 20 isoform X2 [Scyliorhinus canicula]|uniref:small integral membrane protein 20 isoform X2 n=1 Tax=Scyliorhinus canicula TaxID=7830 RepID=UPI0018F5CB95|nr:small integral membrane protein 20 isoform X2 [Scyliorhinus canicula]
MERSDCWSCLTGRAMSGNARMVLLFGGFAAVLGAAFYPIYFRPLLNTEEYRQEQKLNRTGINQEEIQPGGMKVWSDPFNRK